MLQKRTEGLGLNRQGKVVVEELHILQTAQWAAEGERVLLQLDLQRREEEEEGEGPANLHYLQVTQG